MYKKVCKSLLKEQAKETINFERKEKKSVKRLKPVVSLEKVLQTNMVMIKRYCKIRNHCHCTGKCRGPGHSISNLRCSIIKEISVIFHNGSNYHYDFIINESAKEFEQEFICLGGNAKKYKTSSVLK